MRLNFACIVAALLASAASVHAAPLTAAGSTGSDLRIRGSDVIETRNTGLVNVKFMSLSAGEDFDSPRLHLFYETIEERVKIALANHFSVPLYNIRFKNDYKNDFALEPKGPSEILVWVTESNKQSFGTLFSINRNSVAIPKVHWEGNGQGQFTLSFEQASAPSAFPDRHMTIGNAWDRLKKGLSVKAYIQTFFGIIYDLKRREGESTYYARRPSNVTTMILITLFRN
ncbi:hypothetical protein EV359DRAFT_61067 [Lentinula novae-zelandiae]|nr:hypothetical protein EV359DRAFT_61067 [Lentinula novae-zelandiae]